MGEKEIIEIVDEIIARKGILVSMVIPVLQDIQDKFNYLPEIALKRVCDITNITPARINGISTFYSQFRHKPVGKHIIKVCVGTACHVKGALQVYDAIKRRLNLKNNEDTDVEGLFTIDKIACLGCCTIAPVVQIDDITYGHVTTDQVSDLLNDFLSAKDTPQIERYSSESESSVHLGEIRIGLGSCCVASGSAEVKKELEKTIAKNRLDISVKHVGCVGICNQVPLLEIHKQGESPAYYTKIKPDEIRKVVFRHFMPKNPIVRLKNRCYSFFEKHVIEGVPQSYKMYASEKKDTPIAEFIQGQVNIATEYHGILNPSDLNEYMSLDGFKALKKCLNGTQPEDIIEIIKQSGLKGRGGGGFPSGVKWQMVRNTKAEKKYVICNSDEGDPGAFMDRMLLESYPFRIIEGMVIAAYAVGANNGIFYIRAEYPLAVKRIRESIKICEDNGLLGENILDSGFTLKIKIFEGAGAFVCGEETALIASIEGRRGFPSLRPPYPAEKGLWEQPTLINNTETFSFLPWIIRNGAEAFSKIGTENSKGTKVFALAGKVKRGGLIEIPMGITIKNIVEDIGGGIEGGKYFKAVQIGGPSGGCIPSSMADTPIDFISLIHASAMMGSGGLVVLDETDCMVDIAHYFLSFTQDQSCGRCTFCRVGTRRMLEILDKIRKGKGVEEDIETLEHLAKKIKKGSICGLGKSAPNPVVSTIKYFRSEYEAHIKGFCPTGKCKDIITYEITSDCIGCTKCAQRCPSGAIEAQPYEKHEVDTEKCIKCDICKQICPVNAVIIK